MEANEQELVAQALNDITEWMREHGASSFVEKLRPGGSDSALDSAEKALGAPLGIALRTLYRWHDGQTGDHEPFFERDFFLELGEALRQRPVLLDCYFRPPEGSTFESYHERHGDLTREELTSDRWFPFANTAGDFLAVQLDTGRVVQVLKGDFPWIRLLAPDLATYLGDYATRLWDGHLELHGDPALPGVTQDGLHWLGRYFAPI